LVVAPRETVMMRSLMVFWNRAASTRQPGCCSAAPTSIWRLVSGLRLGLPKVRPPPTAVKSEASSVAVGARKPVEAAARSVSRSVAFQVAPADQVWLS